MLIASVFIILVLGSYVTATVAAQMFGGKISIFALNVYRFSIHSAIALVWVVMMRYSIKVSKGDVYKFVISIALNFIKSTLFYTAATYLPVGNLDGIYAGLLLFFSTIMDFANQKISKPSILVSLLAIIGVTMISQPWNMWDTSHFNLIWTPCDYLDNYNISMFLNVSVFNTTRSGDAHFNHSSIAPVIFGYIPVLIAAVCSVISCNIFKSILQSYSVSCVFFWVGIAQCILSLVTAVILKLTNDVTLMLPSGYMCLGYSVLFLVSTTITSMSVNSVYKVINISKYAVSKAFALITLYFVQRTYLKNFNPGEGNLLEIFGVILTLLASILCPLVSIIFENKAD